jgi:outer membrane protein OmpA-like peptidoglycan-associated protein
MRRSRPRSSLALVVLIPLAVAARSQAQTGPEDEPLPPALSVPGTPAAGAPPPASPPPPAMPEAPPPAPAAPPASAVESPRAVSDSFLPSLSGPIGLYRVSTAEVGPVDHLRLALHGQFFHASDFLVQGDQDTRLGGTFSFGFTPYKYVELFGALLTSSNRNSRPPEANRRDPELIKSFGDLILGGKGVYPVARGLTVGGELGLEFLSAISDLAFSPSSTSLWVGPLATYDLRPATGVPLRFHANVSYYLDNSRNLYDFTGTTIFTREVAMFAYGIADSRVRFALGVDAPLEQLTAPVPLQLFAEYHLEVATDSADPAFAAYPSPNNRYDEWLTLGVRARVFHGITLDAGVDLTAKSVGYGYGPPLPPYDIVFGVGYPLDIDAFTHPVVVTRTIEPEPAPSTGGVTGTVKAAADGKPIADAVVVFGGRARARVATDPDGSFASGPLPPGPVDVEVTGEGFEPGKASAAVAAGGSTNIDFSLTAKVVSGNVRGKVADGAGHGIGATLHFIGGTTFEARSDLGGLFSAALPAGPYRVTIEAPGFPTKEVALDIAAGQDRPLDVTLRPANPDVTLTGQTIVLRVPIKFLPGAPKLTPVLKAELEGVGELLVDHPEIKRLRIEAHWSGPQGKTGAKSGAAAKALTRRQADVIKGYLTAKGAPAERIEAVGLGSESPLVPNLGSVNQKKNRRVELIVVL